MNWTLLASEGRAAAQFIVRLKGIGGAATNKQFPGFRASEKLGNGHRGSHDALLAGHLPPLVSPHMCLSYGKRLVCVGCQKSEEMQTEKS